MKHFILVLVNVKTQEVIGCEFCKDLDDMDWKRQMFLDDFGPDHVALTYPDGLTRYADAMKDALAA